MMHGQKNMKLRLRSG